MKIAIMGFGGRGETYAHFTKFYGHEVCAICDPDLNKKKYAMEEYGVKSENYYTSEEEFFSKGKIADALVIATLDDIHHRQTMKALEIGYDILLEKPIAMTKEHCIEIRDKANELNRKIVVCHVLRYSPIYCKIKRLVDDKVIGDIVNISFTEEIAYYHFAHSFVRGNWRNTTISAPLILAKNCHHTDLINWIVGKECLSVSSIGSLNYFKKENAPKGASKHCVDCIHKDTCQFSCFRIYLNKEYEKLAALAKHGQLGTTDEEIIKNISNKGNVYSRCVFACDNNVYDNQLVNMTFEGNITAHLNSTAFSERMGEELKIYGTKGAIYLVNEEIYLELFGEQPQKISVELPIGGYANHSGGDVGIMKLFVEYLETGNMPFNLTSIDVSVRSHEIGFMAQESSENDGKVIFF